VEKAKLLKVTVARRVAGRHDRVAVGVFTETTPGLAALGPELAAAVRSFAKRRGFAAGEAQSAEGAIEGGTVLAVHGLGPAKDFQTAKLAQFLERALDGARAAGARSLLVALPDHAAVRALGAPARLIRDAALGGYRFDRFLSAAKAPALAAVDLLPMPDDEPAFRAEREAGLATAAGIALARDLANTPPNEADPAWMARQAVALARRWRARATVLAPAELARRGMGGILAVGGGSPGGPRMVRLERGRGPLTVALVGKGVTFDTGGISIKPAAQMDEMKWDKCGACAVLGIFEAATALDLPVRLRAYLPFAENMPDGSAFRPGDIVRIANGKTVEIFNTDAEGRMILADALSWAAAEKPDYLVEFSTLTGACVVALGPTGAGLFTPHDELAGALLVAAERSGERLWRMPLWSEFLDEMKGTHADLKNLGGRWGGASAAAAFLSQFAAPVERWAHLDIAGPAYVGGDGKKRGATGYGVGLTLGWLRALAARA
jgi:leucyl aminopeptidase